MYLGLFLEGAGIAAIMSSVAGMVVALTALPLYLTMASELEEQHLLRAQPASDIAWWRQRQRAIVVPVRSWVLLLALPVFVYAMVSLCTRELSIFESDLETARRSRLGIAVKTNGVVSAVKEKNTKGGLHHGEKNTRQRPA